MVPSGAIYNKSWIFPDLVYRVKKFQNELLVFPYKSGENCNKFRSTSINLLMLYLYLFEEDINIEM